MVVEIPAYVCQRCGYYELGEKNKGNVEEHEKITESGRCDSLDGLITQFNSGSISVFRETKYLSQKHERLYIWDNYNLNSLKVKKSGLPKEVEESIKRVLGRPGFTASYITTNIFSYPIRQLPKREFQRVSSKLKELYLDLYAEKSFKREFTGK